MLSPVSWEHHFRDGDSAPDRTVHAVIILLRLVGQEYRLWQDSTEAVPVA